MRTLRNIVESLSRLPMGASADGRPIGLGLDAALQAQRARGADAQPLQPRRPVSVKEPVAHAS